MAITDRLVLPVDVSIRPVAELPPRLRARLQPAAGDFAITRPRRRANAKLLSPAAAVLLEEFRRPCLVSEAVVSYAYRHGLDPEEVLHDAFGVLGGCYDAAFLVSEGSPEAAPVLATRERGDRIGPFEVLRCVRLLADTELYQGRGADGTLVAVKLVRPGAPPGLSRQLTREAAVLRHLAGDGAPRLIGVGRSRDRRWLAMAWSAGVSPEIGFGQLREAGTLDARATLKRLAAAVVARYAALHARGVLHGDVQPGNLMLDRDGAVTLLDFGLAHAIAPLRLAGAPGFGGTAPYYAPEVAEPMMANRQVPPPTEASEQFTVAALLYYLLAGRPYADFDLSRHEMLKQIVSHPPLTFAARRVPPWPALERVLGRAMAKSPAVRFPSMQAFADALDGVAVAPLPPRQPRPDDGAGLARLLREIGIDSRHLNGRNGPTVTAPTASIMFGRAGLAYALYRLACLRDEPELLSLADVWLARAEQDVASRHPRALAAPDHGLDPATLGPVSLFHAATGLSLVRSFIAKAVGDDRGTAAAVREFVDGSRAEWGSLDPTIGRPAILLGAALLLEAHQAAETAGTLRELGSETLSWLSDRLEPLGPIGSCPELRDPAVAHGWAGVLYAVLLWCRTAKTPPPDRVRERLDQLPARAEPVGRGIHWVDRVRGPIPEGHRADSSWCHGPAGFIALWTLAHGIYHEPAYLSLAEGCGWTTWDDSDMFPSLCCGLAGRAYGLLNLYRHTGDTEWLERARVLGQRAARAAEHPRVRFDFPLSLYKGRPGVALLQADLERPEASCMPCFEPEGWPEPGGR